MGHRSSARRLVVALVAVAGIAAANVPAGANRATGATYSATVLADSPLAYYRLDDATTRVAVDASPNALNGQYQGASTSDPSGVITGDAAMHVPGSEGARAIAPHDTRFNALGTAAHRDFAIEVWVNTLGQDPGFDGSIITKGSGCPFTGYTWTIQFDNSAQRQVIVSFATGSSYIQTVIDDGTVLHAAGWHQIVVSDKRGNITTYFDGNKRTTLKHVTAAGFGKTNVAIGDEKDCSSLQPNISIDEASIYDHFLTAARVKAHYKAAIH